ncbi:MAG: hypothetical protein ACLVKR_07835 [Lachnospiraceae bacterium]
MMCLQGTQYYKKHRQYLSVFIVLNVFIIAGQTYFWQKAIPYTGRYLCGFAILAQKRRSDASLVFLWI